MKISNKIMYASLVLGLGFGKSCFSCPQEIPFTALTSNNELARMSHQHFLFQPITVGNTQYQADVRFTDKDKKGMSLTNVVNRTSVLTIPKTGENATTCTYTKSWGDQTHNTFDITVTLHR